MNNSEKYKPFYKKGKKIEEKFAADISKCDFKVLRWATEKQDKEEHWDLEFCKTDGSIPLKTDVKGIKAIKRNYGREQDLLHWVEFINGDGYWGWIFGKADAFAFETFEYWVVVLKEDLQNLLKLKFEIPVTEDRDVLFAWDSEMIQNLKTSQKVVRKTPSIPYQYYRRSGRDDLIALITNEDIMSLCYLLFQKTI